MLKIYDVHLNSFMCFELQLLPCQQVSAFVCYLIVFILYSFSFILPFFLTLCFFLSAFCLSSNFFHCVFLSFCFA